MRAAAIGLLSFAAPVGGVRTLRQVPEAQAPLPTLTGRVVDNAGLLRPETIAALTARLTTLEAKTSDQLVVATVTSLGGQDVDAFGLRLGNMWGIGTKELDNGVLLIVAPVERKVRIEVGYGLERLLTDARAAAIIDKTILPAFRTGRMEDGVTAGVAAIVAVLEARPDKSLRGRTR